MSLPSDERSDLRSINRDIDFVKGGIRIISSNLEKIDGSRESGYPEASPGSHDPLGIAGMAAGIAPGVGALHQTVKTAMQEAGTSRVPASILPGTVFG
jgi:hypothetical protein